MNEVRAHLRFKEHDAKWHAVEPPLCERHYAIAGVTVMYVSFGACGYLVYGDATMDIIMLNLLSTWSTATMKDRKTRSFTNKLSIHTYARPAPSTDEMKPNVKKWLLFVQVVLGIALAPTFPVRPSLGNLGMSGIGVN